MRSFANVFEILLVFAVAAAIVTVGWWSVGEDAFKRQAVVWVANVAMLLVIWNGLRRRGQSWEAIGLGRKPGSWRAPVVAVLLSLGVAAVAIVAFIAGSVLAAPLAGAAPRADMSGYDYLRGNLPMLLLALGAVYIVSSFGEEVVYRGFLMTRVAEMGQGSRAAWAAAVVVGAIAFGVVHFSWGWVGIVQTTLMGVALGVSYLVVKRNLWVMVMAHAYIDTLLLVQLYLGAGTGGR